MAKAPEGGPGGPPKPPKPTPEIPKPSMDKAMKALGKNTFAKQLVTGTGAGVLTGIVVGAAGKALALLAGTGVIALQVANHTGYTNKDLDSLKAQYKNTPNVQKVRNYVAKNRVFSSGFMGGFLLGLAI